MRVLLDAATPARSAAFVQAARFDLGQPAYRIPRQRLEPRLFPTVFTLPEPLPEPQEGQIPSSLRKRRTSAAATYSSCLWTPGPLGWRVYEFNR